MSDAVVSTLNVERSVVSVAVWNDVTDVLTAAMIVAGR